MEHPPLTPSESTGGSSRHPLVWLFNYFRQEGKSSLCREDLEKLVGPQVDPVQLDLAFEKLDADRDGVVSMDEFIAGFARFWKEAPNTPAHKRGSFSFSPSHSLLVKSSLPTQHPLEEHYEYEGNSIVEEVAGPDENFQKTLGIVSSHNRHSMEQLWRTLKEANPELLTDFEEFVSEVASEVEGAQRALENQRKAIKKEAMELDDEIESRLSAAQTTLNIQTNLVRQEEKYKLERRLVAKESELSLVRNKLQELESEVVNTQQNKQELEQHCQDLQKEKQELKERLERSEKKLQETQVESHGEKIQQLDRQQKQQSHQESELLQQKKLYEEEILKLRKELEVYSKHTQLVDEEVESLMKKGVARPDLLVTTHAYQQPTSDTGSLMQEIVAKEGMASPMLRREHALQVSPFQRTRAGSMRKKASSDLVPLRRRSLPNLADIDSLEPPELVMPVPSNRFSMLLPSQLEYSPALEPPNVVFNAGEGVAFSAGEGQEEDAEEPADASKDPQESFEAWCKPLEFMEILPGQPDYIFKVLIVGNSYVGKSSYLMQLCNHSFSQRYCSTIGVDFYTKALKMDEKLVSLQLWDTAGQERFQSVTKAYYRGAQGVILMYDITQEESFIAVKSWVNSIQENADQSPAAMCLVGNKLDMDAMKEREVSAETGETFAKIYGADFIETSAKTGYNVGKSLLRLVRALKTHYENTQNSKDQEKEVVLSDEERKPQQGKCCGR